MVSRNYTEDLEESQSKMGGKNNEREIYHAEIK